MIVKPFNQAEDDLGKSNQGQYLGNYIKKLDAKAYVAEQKYIDKDYLIDYSKFYARSFEDITKYTSRLHFFSIPLSERDLNQALLNYTEEHLRKFNDAYLGFVVIKPINDSNGNPLIGRTLLRPLNKENKQYSFLTIAHSVSLFGIPLTIKSLPFQSQDRAVGACSTTALWVSQSPLIDQFGIQKYSPFEITETSISFPGEQRNFPSSGLNFWQIKNYFNLTGFEIETINVENSKHKKYIVADAVKTYIGSGFPLIAALRINKEGNEEELHAAVISGYKLQEGIINELYVHDDQIGPYSKVTTDEDFSTWKNEWITQYKCDKVTVEKLFIPIYPKIRLTFARIYQVLLDKREIIEKNKSLGFNIDLCLAQIKEYKKFLLEHSFENKETILLAPFPRFLWIVRTYLNKKTVEDSVFDGTSVNLKKCCTIKFTE